ncbi:LacI family transcriptional regulator [Microlunatus elymi]|uniref:LacI family transcriptional regulator n=1 Tax=Microlunatus elymi TaxID=2596828 RepID=A0A516PXN3_9ACTN|nr:LacI family DNA-binding transcriptional regulator [Microlunatus elymi]QDP95721.1 LacI family transcriptional regulator [Microlunatus elymi]
MAGRKPTMRDVAARAGVGVGTVSRVVNKSSSVSAETRARVEKAIAETGFHRNEVARMLRPGQASATVGLIIDDLENPFSSEVAAGALQVAKGRDHVLLIGSTERDAQAERDLVREFVRRQVDGLLIVSSDRKPIDETLGIGTVPVVYVDRAPAGGRYDRVLLDNHSGVKSALNGLLEAGHRRIAYIGGSPDATTGATRLRSYKQLLSQRGIRPDADLISMHNYSTDSARESTIGLLTRRRPPTAIFSDNNRMTLGVLQALTTLGTTVALAGFDDLELADLLPFEVDLVVYSPADLGRRGAEQLFRRIDGDTGPARTLRVPTRLDRRGRRFHAPD